VIKKRFYTLNEVKMASESFFVDSKSNVDFKEFTVALREATSSLRESTTTLMELTSSLMEAIRQIIFFFGFTVSNSSSAFLLS
jgi:hypothetical protein